MNHTFVLPDLHGRFDLLNRAISELEDRVPGGTVVFLGDYVDRGPNSRGVIDTLIKGPPLAWRWICLKGNHEEMLVDAHRNGGHNWWLGSGGYETLESYGGPIPAEHLEWIDQLPLIHLDAHRVYVHAGVDPQLALTAEAQGPENLLWLRYRDRADVVCDRHIVHGHTPYKLGPILMPGRTNLDTGAVFYGRLTIGVFCDDLAGGPIEIINVT